MAEVGSKIPEATVYRMGEKGPEGVSTTDLFKGRKVVAFAVPGAFTPTCSAAHLPGFVTKADDIKAAGADAVMCLAVNDAFVMDAWGKAHNAEAIEMIGDGNGAFTEAMDLGMDGKGFGLGKRCQRYAMIVNDGVIEALCVDEPGKLDVSSAEHMLELLKNG